MQKIDRSELIDRSEFSGSGNKRMNLQNDWQDFFATDEEVDMDLEFEVDPQELRMALDVDGEVNEKTMERLNVDARERAFGKSLKYGGA